MADASLTARLAAGVGGVAALSGLLVGVPLTRTTRALLESSVQERAESCAETVAVALRQVPPGDAALRPLLADLADEADVDRLDVTDGAGRLVASSDAAQPPGRADDLLAAMDLVAIGRQDAATTPVHVDAAGRASVVAVAPIEDATPARFVVVRAPASWTEPMDQLDLRILLAVGAWIAAASTLGALVIRRSLAPLDQLGEAARRLADGAPSPPLPRTQLREIDRLATEFERMRGAIAGRERWLRALAGTVAHEVRNPAHALRLHLGLLRRALPPEVDAGRLDRLDAELDELEATVSSLLAFAEGAPARRAATPLRALLEHAAPGAAVEAPDAEVDIDAVLVGRAVGNLVRNARQAGAEHVTVRATADDAAWTVRVLDDGRGFDPGLAADAFEPFAHAAPEGTGLGLALVSAVARAHGGHAWIAAPGPGGTVVAFTLARR